MYFVMKTRGNSDDDLMGVVVGGGGGREKKGVGLTALVSSAIWGKCPNTMSTVSSLCRGYPALYIAHKEIIGIVIL